MRASIAASKLRRRSRVCLEVLEDRQLLATITVNTTADGTAAASTLSLREAIEVSNGTLSVSSLSTQQQAQVSGAVGNTNTIDFNIPTTDQGYNAATGVWTIAVEENPLPTISTNAAIINGYSQPGSSKNTLAHGDNAKLTIALNGGEFAGLTLGQQGSQVSGLDIEKFLYGVVITAPGNVQVAGCFIGTDSTGETAAPNGDGVVIENSSNLIGGPNVGDRNVISGNSLGAEIYVPDKTENPLGITPSGNLIENNFIGLDATGTKGIPSRSAGVSDQGTGDTYGGTAPGVGNVISGNNEDGIIATGSITIEGNYVGTDANGNVALGNDAADSAGVGIDDTQQVAATATTIISNNLVSGNDDGIYVSTAQGSQSTYTIANNLIGTNAAGTSALGNSGYGIQLESVENATIQNNVISANYEGIDVQAQISSTELQHIAILGNLIGTDRTGTVALGNTAAGIYMHPGSGITIGGTGPGQGNVIANSPFGFGIGLQGGQQDEFIRNSIFGNAGSPGYPAGILSASGAAPVLTFTPGTGSTITLSGTLTEAPNTTYVVEVFSNPSAQTLAQAQGQTFVQDVTLKTDATGKGSFSLTEPNGFYTATSTDPSGNTSVFSNAVGLRALPATATTVTTVSSSQNPATAGQQVTFTAVVTAPSYQGTPTGTVTFTIDGHSQSPVSLSVVGGKDEAQFLTSTLAAGQHTVTAAYGGDTNVNPSSGSLPTQTVSAGNLLATTTTLTSSLDPSTVGQEVTFTAIIAAPGYQGTPTGTVTFTIDGQAQSPVPLAVVGGNDEAKFVTSTLAPGSHSVTASFNGDTNVSPSSGSLPTQTVNAPGLKATSITVTSSLDPSTVGQPVTFTAVVSPGAAAGTPTGTVTFTIDGKAEAPVPLTHDKSGAAHASFQISTLSAGKHTVTASYSGDSTDAASSPVTPLLQTVIASTVGAPRVTLVQRFGVHMHPTVLVLSFDAALDPASATSLQNYALVGPEGNHIGFKSVSYDSSAHTVTLRPTVKINVHRTYRLTVIGNDSHGVCGVDRALLDGRLGQLGDGLSSHP